MYNHHLYFRSVIITPGGNPIRIRNLAFERDSKALEDFSRGTFSDHSGSYEEMDSREARVKAERPSSLLYFRQEIVIWSRLVAVEMEQGEWALGMFCR